ncbi:unnamed protein product [Cylindrotheca closterium]|uniref:Uncharacterized protein n=1 Tax=Cylindrotheca closterium TaxID=2856 RepID=A0AAD2CX68_9STRA|nr:unnamed protein product [Cylindrotheca closterium]
MCGCAVARLDGQWRLSSYVEDASLLLIVVKNVRYWITKFTRKVASTFQAISEYKEALEENVAQLQRYHMDDSMSNLLDFYRSNHIETGMPSPAFYLMRRMAVMDSLREESRSQNHLEFRINEVALAAYWNMGSIYANYHQCIFT